MCKGLFVDLIFNGVLLKWKLVDFKVGIFGEILSLYRGV